MRAPSPANLASPRPRDPGRFATLPRRGAGRCTLVAALVLAWFAATVLAAGAAAALEIAHGELSGRIAAEGRWFYQDNAHAGQDSHNSGLVVEPRLYVEDDGGRSITVKPFFRYDAGDAGRTHADLREGYFLIFGEAGEGEWELRLGVDRVFWGVAESRHLVDIVNQTDLVEHPNEEAKLGQLMAHLTFAGEWGALELFALPYHRQRTFPGRSGRLRSRFVVDDEHVSYESAAGEWHVDLAARYSRSAGPLDLGLSVFDGTSREPCLACVPPRLDERREPLLVQHYEQIRQFGLDAQITIESWLLKLEVIHRAGASNGLGREQDYAAFVAGGEYTFNAVFDSNADLGLLAEWTYDGRGDNAPHVFNNEAFAGVRLALNDVEGTQMTVSILWDLDHESRSLGLELTRRLTDQWSLEVAGTFFVAVDEEDLNLYQTRRDSFVEMGLTYHF